MISSNILGFFSNNIYKVIYISINNNIYIFYFFLLSESKFACKCLPKSFSSVVVGIEIILSVFLAVLGGMLVNLDLSNTKLLYNNKSSFLKETCT